MAKLGVALLGVAVALGSWLALVPWDLSELDADGAPREPAGDDYGWMIALVGLVVVVIAISLLTAPRTRQSAMWFAVGGMVTWAALFAWRAGVAETVGANMFLIPLVFAMIPLTVAVPLLLRQASRRLADRQ